MPIDASGEKWGVVGVAADYQALQYLERQGPLKKQTHLAEYIRSFLIGRSNFLWEDILLVWEYLPDGDS
jgi:hypothetical protein